MFSKFMGATAAVALAAAPVAAQAAPERVPAPVSEKADALRGSPLFLVIALAVAVALGIILLSDSDDPVSP